MRSFYWRVFLAQLLSLAVALGAIIALLSYEFRDIYLDVTRRHLESQAKDVAARFSFVTARQPSPR